MPAPNPVKSIDIKEKWDPHTRFGYSANEAEAAIAAKVRSLNGAPGKPLGPVAPTAPGLVIVYSYQQQFENGVIYWAPPSEPFWVLGAILAEYQALGGPNGFLGFPLTDEMVAPDNTGRYSHFQHGSIYWSPATGAHEVHGAIRDRWAALAWERGWLGYPVVGERPFTEGGAVSVFQHGSIYWWPDVGAIELGQVRLAYKGLYCFGTTSGGGDDEPYVLFGTVSVPLAQGTSQHQASRTPIYEDIDGGRSRSADIEVFRGDPLGLSLGCVLMEHDEGNPDEYLGLVQQGVELVGKGVSAACGALAGEGAAKICDSIWKEVGPKIAKAINDVLGTDDDVIGGTDLALTAKQMVLLARTPLQHFTDLDYHWESPLISDGDASYKLYFSVEAV